MKNFITFEGTEGVGKSTQLRFLGEYCKSNNVNALFTREPGGSDVAEQIRKVILYKGNTSMDDKCEAFLYSAARAQHIKDTVAPALAAGKIVFCDRYIDSTYAYQGFGRGMGLDFVKQLNALAIGQYMPSLTVFLDLPPEQAFLRKGGVDKSDRMEQSGREFFERVYAGYKAVAKQDPDRFVVIDASGDKHATHAKIVAALKQRGVL